MKKYLAILILIPIFLLVGCDLLTEDEVESGFFDNDYLAECKLLGLPVPDTEDIKHDDNTVYCNLTSDKFESYVSEVVSFLISKDDIYFKGYHYETGNPGGIFFLPEYRFAPLTIDANYSTWFAFSLTEQLNDDDEFNYSYWNGITVKIEQKEGKIGSYSYNTVIVIDDDPNFIVYQINEHSHIDDDKNDVCDICCSVHEHSFGEWQYDEKYHWCSWSCSWDACDIDTILEHFDEDDDKICDVCGYVINVHEHTGELLSVEGGHWYQYTCGCESPDILELHSDYDANFICDICGYNMPEHEHTYQNYQDENGHSWSYTCGCMTPPNFAQHHDGNGDGKCDDCSYQIVAEGNHFIRNQTGAEWLLEINAEDITEIKMISGGGGPLPPVSFTYISSSENEAIISNIFEEYYWLDSKPVSEEDTQIADGGYFVVQFILNSGEVKQLYFINGEFYHDGNGNYFELVRLPVFRDGTNFVSHYGFEIWEKNCQVYLIDETFVCEIPVSEFEFVELTDDIYLGETDPDRYIEINGEKLYFIKDSYFYIGDDRSIYYELVSNSLDELIMKYSK